MEDLFWQGSMLFWHQLSARVESRSLLSSFNIFFPLFVNNVNLYFQFVFSLQIFTKVLDTDFVSATFSNIFSFIFLNYLIFHYMNIKTNIPISDLWNKSSKDSPSSMTHKDMKFQKTSQLVLLLYTMRFYIWTLHCFFFTLSLIDGQPKSWFKEVDLG